MSASEGRASHHLTADSFRLLVESVEDYAIFMLDVEGRVITWNRGAHRIKGYTSEEILGRHFSTFYPAEDIAAGKPERELRDALRDGRVEDEGWRHRKDGSRMWANVVITTLRDAQGRHIGFAKVTRDLTQRRAVAEQLRASEERFRTLLEGIHDYAVYMLDPTGHVTTWNAGAAKIKGFSATEIIGTHYSAFFTPEALKEGRPKRELETALSAGRFEEEGWRLRKDGSRFWANVVLTPLYGGGGEHVGFAKITRDLTQRRQAEEVAQRLLREQAAREAAERTEAQLRDEQERYKAAARDAAEAALAAEEASRLKDDFLATVSHELRTPLNAILGWASMLKARPKDGTAVKGLDVIQRNAHAQAKIIDDILDLSRIVAGKLRLELRQTDLASVIQDAIEVARPSALAKSIKIELVPSAQPCLLMADPERLQQVMWNLLSNAVKFTDAGGSIRISVESSGAKAKVSVTDTGRGIAPEFLPYVFDRFRQADGSTTRRVGGLGLGLSIARQIVELHGGQVGAYSAGSGTGASLTIILPIRAAQAVSPPGRAAGNVPADAADRPATHSLGGLKVLVVDDEPDARELLEAQLQEAGARVQTAGSAASAFELLQQFRPELLISDIGMPDEDGYSLMRRIRALPPALGGRIPSIALTAFVRSADQSKALAAGFSTYLGKPIDPQDLLAAVVNLAGPPSTRAKT